MPRYLIRVTRTIEADADVEVEADDWEKAKSMAIKLAQDNADTYFDTNAGPVFYVSDMDDEEEQGLLEDE